MQLSRFLDTQQKYKRYRACTLENSDTEKNLGGYGVKIDQMYVRSGLVCFFIDLSYYEAQLPLLSFTIYNGQNICFSFYTHTHTQSRDVCEL